MAKAEQAQLRSYKSYAKRMSDHVAFALVVFAYPAGSVAAFCLGAFLIGFGGGLFAVGTLTAVMAIASYT